MADKKSMSMSKKRRIGNIVTYVVLILVSVIWILPFVFLVLQSFRTENTGIVNYVFPHQWGFDNYIFLFSAETNFLQWYFNTFIIALFVCVLQTAMQFMMSYTLSRFRFKLRKPLMNVMLVLGMFPGFLTMIVLYQVLKSIGLTGDNAVPGLILVSVASSGMGYYVSKGFLDTLPKSLDEAVLIDGGSKNTVFWKIILPLSRKISPSN